MRSFKQHMIFSLLILFTCYDELMTADSSCGDWEPYKDEKCFKVLGKVGTEEEAEKICSQQENSSTLITIHSKEEQDFLSNLLFKTHNVVDSVWIGAKYSSNKLKWADDSDLSFTNWDNGSPSNTTDKACVQMIAEGSSMGKWITEPCSKSNKVVCQKKQTWSLSLMQKSLLDARKKLSDSLEDAKKEISDLKQNLIPIGFIYVQLPNEKSPIEIWPWMTWKDVTLNYAGLFFRAEGGSSLTFGSTQDENSPGIVSIRRIKDNSEDTNIRVVSGSGKFSEAIHTGDNAKYGYYDNVFHLKFEISDGEVRPRNTAMRIWKRTN